jgi:nucleoside-diphosphate-sugar epimerase
MSTAWSLERDLDEIVDQAAAVWPGLRGARLFITGGTGLLGKWLLESLRQADQRMGLGVEAVILTRSAAAFAAKCPRLAAYPAFRWIEGDVATFDFPNGAFSHVIHAATDASADLNEHNPRQMFDTVVAGTRRVLDFCVEAGAPRLLYLSSGAVYGQQPWELTLVGEDWLGGPDCRAPRNAYAEGKRTAEILCAIYAKQFGLEIVTARIFALLGPMLDLNIHFAAGNFIRDAIAGEPVIVQSDGRPCRSYLYTGDLTAWLWRMLGEASAGACYNAGSEHTVSIAELAERVAGLVGNAGFKVLGMSDSGWNPGRYAPDTSLARRDLGLQASVSLDEAILRTALWNGWKDG